MILIIIDKAQLGKSVIAKLEYSSLKSLVHEPIYHEVRPVSSNIKAISKILSMENALITTFKGMSASQSPISIVDNPLLASRNSGLSRKLAFGIWPVYAEAKLPELYYFYMSQKRTYLGCDAIFFPKGISIGAFGMTLLQINPSVVENFVLYFVNSDPVFSCLYTLKYSYVSRNGRRIVYIVSNCVIFFIQAFTGSIFNLYDYGLLLSNAFDVCVVSPLVSQIEELVLLVYLLRNRADDSSNYSINYCLRLFRPVILTLLVLVSLMSIFIASLFAYNSDNLMIIISFIVYVQVPAFVYHLVKTMLCYVSTFHFSVYVQVCSKHVPLLNIGQYYVEALIRRHAIEGKDYITMEWSIAGGCLVCNYVVDKKYADMKGLQKVTLAGECKVYSDEDIESAFALSNIYGSSRVSYADRHNLDNIVNSIAESMKCEENSVDMKRESEDGIVARASDTGDSSIELVDFYRSDQNTKKVDSTSHHALFMKELSESASFKQRFQLASSTLSPMHTITDENERMAEQLPKYNDESSYRTSTSENLVLSTKKADKLLAEGKRKSFVNVFKTWELMESTSPTAGSSANTSSAANTVALYKNVKAKNVLLKSVNNKK